MRNTEHTLYCNEKLIIILMKHVYFDDTVIWLFWW